MLIRDIAPTLSSHRLSCHRQNSLSDIPTGNPNTPCCLLTPPTVESAMKTRFSRLKGIEEELGTGIDAPDSFYADRVNVADMFCNRGRLATTVLTHIHCHRRQRRSSFYTTQHTFPTPRPCSWPRVALCHVWQLSHIGLL